MSTRHDNLADIEALALSPAASSPQKRRNLPGLKRKPPTNRSRNARAVEAGVACARVRSETDCDDDFAVSETEGAQIVGVRRPILVRRVEQGALSQAMGGDASSVAASCLREDAVVTGKVGHAAARRCQRRASCGARACVRGGRPAGR